VGARPQSLEIAEGEWEEENGKGKGRFRMTELVFRLCYYASKHVMVYLLGSW